MLLYFVSQETQNDSDKLKRDQLSNGIVSSKEREKDLLEFIKQNEAMDPEKAEIKLKSEAKVGFAGWRDMNLIIGVIYVCLKESFDAANLHKYVRSWGENKAIC